MNNRRWLPATEYALLFGSGAGAVASLLTQNAAIASLPITALVAMGLLQRRRVDQSTEFTTERINVLEERALDEVSNLSERVSALPSPEAIRGFQQAAMEHTDRGTLQCSQVMEQTKREVEERIQHLTEPNLSPIQQEISQLQDLYTDICTSVNTLSKQMDRASSLPRMEDTEDEVAQLKTEIMQLRVSLETLGTETKTSQTTLQDAMRHLDRRLRQVPASGDPNLLKDEVRELIRAVADLVPRREFAALSEQLQALQDTQTSLRQTIGHLQSASQPIEQNGHIQPHTPGVKALESEVGSLANHLRDVELRLEDIAVPFDITSEIRGTTATYLSSLQWQLALLEQQTQDLLQQQREMGAAPRSQPLEHLKTITTQAQPAASDAPMQWLMAFRGEASEGQWSAIDRALMRSLDEVSERLVLVWPWSSAIELDERLVARFEEILEQKCRLEIGWCHPGNRQEGRLLKNITQQWNLTTAQRHLLKSTLNKLLPLKQKYAEHFSFKILGTHEQFLVCDRSYAVVGLQSLPAASSAFTELDLRVKTTEMSVIDRLLHRFENPDALPEDATAYFNRAITRYDLRDADGAIADFSKVIRMNPEDAVASNNRAVIWAEKKQHQRALEDLNRALANDTYLFAARCNRGWLQMSGGNFNQAIIDFDYAAQSDHTSSLPYFYRGTARQKLGDSLGAIADYTKAIQKSPQAALSYCYRGSAYQRSGDIARAVTDLETAASLLHAQGDHRALAQVTQVLSTLKQPEVIQPLQLRSA